MNKLLLIAALLLPTVAFAQGSHRINQVLARGSAVSVNVVPYAKILVCTAGTNCVSTANIYLDLNLSVPAVNPTTADASGNYSYYVAAGCYDEQISAPGTTPYTVPNVCLSSGGVIAPPASTSFLGSNSASSLIAAPYTPVNKAGDTMTGTLAFGVTNPPSCSLFPGRSFYPELCSLLNYNGTGSYITPYKLQYMDNLAGFTTAWGNDRGNPPVGPVGWTENGPVNAFWENNGAGQLYNALGLIQAGQGDFTSWYQSLYWYGGARAPSDEGGHALRLSLQEMSSTYQGTRTAGATSALQITTACTQDCGNQGALRYLLDTSAPVATCTVSAYVTPGAAPEEYTIGSCSSGSIAASNAWGTLASDCGPTSSQYPVGPQTVNGNCPVNVLSGTFVAGTTVESFAGQFHEQAVNVTASALSGGAQTLNINFHDAHQSGSWVMQGGMAGTCMVPTANITDGLKYPITVLGSPDTTHVYTAAFADGSPQNMTSYVGPFGSGGSQVVTFYPCAEVMDVQNPSTYAVDGSFTLEPNTMTSGGDTLEEEHAADFTAGYLPIIAVQHNPGAIKGFNLGAWSGIDFEMDGSGWYGDGFKGYNHDDTGIGAVYVASNNAPYSAYAGYGGYQIPPSLVKTTTGLFSGLLETHVAPTGGVIGVGCPWNLSGVSDCTYNTSYDLWNLSGNPTYGNSQATYYPATNILVHKGIEQFQNQQNTYVGTFGQFTNGSIGPISVGLFQNFVENSNELTSAGWYAYNTTVTADTTDVTDPLGGNTANKIVFSGSTSSLTNDSSYTPVPSTSYTVCAWLRTASGTVTVNEGVQNSGGTITITPAWQHLCTTDLSPTYAITDSYYMTTPAAATIYLWTANTSLTATPSAGVWDTGPGGILTTPTFSISPTLAIQNTAAVFSTLKVGSDSVAKTGTQGTDAKFMSAGTVSGTGATLCTDANGGATTSGCPSGGGGTSTVTAAAAVTISGTTGYYFNQEATAATAVTYTLPAPTTSSQFCVKNSNNGTAANTGALELLVANTGTQSIIYNGTKSTSGYILSSGAAGDFACVIGISTTQWEATVNVGSWILH